MWTLDSPKPVADIASVPLHVRHSSGICCCQVPGRPCARAAFADVTMTMAWAVCTSSPATCSLALQWWVSGRNYAKYSPEGPRPIAIIKVRKQLQQ